MRLAAVALALAGGCELLVDVPRPNAISDDPNGLGCRSSVDCAAPHPVCDLELNACFECVDSTDCAIGVCTAHVCGPCREDRDCASAVCMPDGSCADAARILHASAAGGGTDCTLAAPCSLDGAAARVTTGLDIVKLAPGDYPRTAPLAITRPTIITGQNAILQAMFAAFAYTLSVSATELTLIGLTVQGTDTGAVVCDSNGTLRLFRTRFTAGRIGVFGNACAIHADRIAISGALAYALYALNGGPVTISNSYITRNGGQSTLGGVYLNMVTAGSIDHTTIASNIAVGGGFSGIGCPMSPAVAIRNSIIYGNTAPSIDATCSVSNSVIDPGYTGTGTGNGEVDPVFVLPTDNDFHLSASSPARGLANPASTMAIDFEGEPRPQPAGSPSDPGADEVP